MKNTLKISFTDIIILVASAIPVVYFYHPFFWGDELVYHSSALANRYSYKDTFLDILEYKPRFIYASITAFLGILGTPRYIEAIMIYLFLVAVQFTFLKYLKLLFGDLGKIKIIIIFLVISFRYVLISYHNYGIGLIEIPSILLLLCLLIQINKWLDSSSLRSMLFTLILSFTLIYTHERYAIGVLFLSISILYLMINKKFKVTVNKNSIIFIFIFSILPILTFWLSSRLLSKITVLTGTAGIPITLNDSIIYSFFSYLVNVFFNGNIGVTWLWGNLNYSNFIGKIILIFNLFGFFSLVLYLWYKDAFLSKRLILAKQIIALVFGLVLVASLVGIERQEMRFIYPVSLLVLVLWFSVLKKEYFIFPVVFYFLGNSFYLISQSLNYTYSSFSHRMVKDVWYSVNTLNPVEKHGFICCNSEFSWPFGSNKVLLETASKLNSNSKYEIAGLSKYPGDDYAKDKFLIYLQSIHGYKRNYMLLDKSDTNLLFGENHIDTSEIEIIGNKLNWDKWIGFRKNFLNIDSSLSVQNLQDCYLPLSVEALKSKILVYSAKSNISNSLFRLQVNWNNKDGVFIGTQIIVVSPVQNYKQYKLLIIPPLDAYMGHVYLTLAGTNTGKVDVEYVGLISR